MYAQVTNNEITQTWSSAPQSYYHQDGSLTLFPIGTTDEQFSLYDIYPVTITNTPDTDGYHNNELTYSVVDSLPTATYNITEVTLEEAKTKRKSYIDNIWMQELKLGKFISSTVTDFEVDCRRYGVDNDVQNLQGVIGLVTNNIITEPVNWKGTTEIRQLTLSQLQGLYIEMLAHASTVYQRKFTSLYNLDLATTIDEVKMVVY